MEPSDITSLGFSLRPVSLVSPLTSKRMRPSSPVKRHLSAIGTQQSGAIATLVKAVADANKDLLELAKKRKDLEKVDNGGPQTVNNNLYLGSTADLLKLLKDNK